MKNKKMWIIGIAALLAVGIAGSVVMAANTDENCSSSVGSQHQVMMDQMVKDGVISADQAKKMQTKMSEYMSQHMSNMPSMMNGMMNKSAAGNCCQGSTDSNK